MLVSDFTLLRSILSLDPSTRMYKDSPGMDCFMRRSYGFFMKGGNGRDGQELLYKERKKTNVHITHKVHSGKCYGIFTAPSDKKQVAVSTVAGFGITGSLECV